MKDFVGGFLLVFSLVNFIISLTVNHSSNGVMMSIIGVGVVLLLWDKK